MQTDPTKLRTTVFQAEKDRIITSSVLPTGAATEATLSAISSNIDVKLSTRAKDRITPTDFHSVRITEGTTFIDPRSIRALTSSDIVTVVQSIPSNLQATVTQAAKDRIVTDITKVAMPRSMTATLAGTTLVWDTAATTRLRVKFIMVFNSGTSPVTVDLRFTTTGEARFKANLAPNSGYTINLVGCNWEGGVGEDLFVNLSAAGTVDITVIGEEV